MPDDPWSAATPFTTAVSTDASRAAATTTCGPSPACRERGREAAREAARDGGEELRPKKGERRERPPASKLDSRAVAMSAAAGGDCPGGERRGSSCPI
eukprot:scaffold45374_cov33-Phaeocystis_antarctica.AAC.1